MTNNVHVLKSNLTLNEESLYDSDSLKRAAIEKQCQESRKKREKLNTIISPLLFICGDLRMRASVKEIEFINKVEKAINQVVDDEYKQITEELTQWIKKFQKVTQDVNNIPSDDLTDSSNIELAEQKSSQHIKATPRSSAFVLRKHVPQTVTKDQDQKTTTITSTKKNLIANIAQAKEQTNTVFSSIKDSIFKFGSSKKQQSNNEPPVCNFNAISQHQNRQYYL